MNACYPVRLYNHDATRQTEMKLPFAPFPGIELQAGWRRGDYVKVAEVFWNSDDGEFECYAAAEPA